MNPVNRTSNPPATNVSGDATITTASAAPRLALRPREAAAALGIGARKLWELTNRGEIPHAKIGRAVVYPVAALEAWLIEESQAAERGGVR